MTEQSIWCPNLSPKQMEVFNCGIEEDASLYPNIPVCLLVSGSRYSGKTIATLHRVCRHLWETPGARVAMFARHMKNLTGSGSFADLVNNIIPTWIESGIGFEFTTFDSAGIPGPKRDINTRACFFRVRNMYGGESELRLYSLSNDAEVESHLKNMSFSMIYFSELTNFSNHRVVRASILQLRMMHLKPWQHMFVADTNPGDEGEDSWIYKYWYQHRSVDSSDGKNTFFGSLKLIEIFMRDNPFISPEQIAYFESLYADDPGDFDRDILGKWTRGHGNKGKHFADVYEPSVHMIGGGEDELDTIDVSPATVEMYTGWDIGSSVNHAAFILEQRIGNVGGKDFSLWVCHDELVSIGERIPLQVFVEEFLEKMHEIETRSGRKFEWTHWADSSALNVYRNAGEGTDALEVQIHSKGEIELNGVAKPAGSVRSRVKIIKRLLREKRLFHASRCTYLRRMFENCKSGSTIKEYVAWDENVHTFDGLSYAIFKEMCDAMVDEAFRPTATEKPTQNLSLNLSPVF